MIRATVTCDAKVMSAGIPCGQVTRFVLLPSAKFTNWISSLIVTMPSPLQSPRHTGGAGAVGESVGVAEGAGVGVNVSVGVSVGVSLAVSLGVCVTVTVGVSVG